MTFVPKKGFLALILFSESRSFSVCCNARVHRNRKCSSPLYESPPKAGGCPLCFGSMVFCGVYRYWCKASRAGLMRSSVIVCEHFVRIQHNLHHYFWWCSLPGWLDVFRMEAWPFRTTSSRVQNRVTTLIRKRQPPWDPPRTLGIGLRKGLRGLCFLISEVPLYVESSQNLKDLEYKPSHAEPRR